MGVIAAKCAERTLNAGFTTYVGAGAIHNIDVVVRNLIDAGEISGPRIIPCSRDFVPTGNIVDFKPDFWHIADTPLADRLGAVCDGPDEFRREIRRDVKRGAQMIKIYPEGGHGLPDLARLSLDEIRTAVETATLCNARVRCHVFSKPVIKTCIEEGVAIIDHGDHFDDELADLAIEHDVYVLPSLYFAKACVGVYHQQEDIDRWFDYARTSLAAGIEKGVKYVTGDDFGLEQLPHGDNAKELALYVNELGVPAKEALKWATANGAEMSGLPDIGRIAEGKFADLVVVDGDPIQDINVLTEPGKIGLVMKGGAIAKSTLSSHGAGEMQRAAAS
jgi:imidazolonepropionase-like amidohydrolase